MLQCVLSRSIVINSWRLATPWSIATRLLCPWQECWSGLLFPPPRALPNPEIEPKSPVSPAAAAAKSPQSCPTLCDPRDGSPPGSPVPGILQARNWSGLPFPSPMHTSEKSKWSHSVVSNPQRPHGLQPTMLLCPWDFPGKSTGVGCHCLLRCLLHCR